MSREACRVAPPSGLRVNPKSAVPVHAELTRYRDELEAELPLQIDRMLVEEFEARVSQDPTFVKAYRVVITTFFHIHEVRRVMPPDAPPSVALLAEASIKTLLRLTELPEGTTV